MKKGLTFLLTILLLVGCSSKNTKTTTGKVADVDSFTGNYYKMINTGRGTTSEDFYLQYSNTKDLVTIGNGLQSLSSNEFSTDSYYLSEGQELSMDDYSSLLQRDKAGTKDSEKKYPYSIQPAHGVTYDNVKDPILADYLAEQDYYKKETKGYSLQGASIAVIINPKDASGNALETDLSQETIKTYCEKVSDTLYQFIRKKKSSLKNIPILIAFYKANDNNISTINGNFIYTSYCENGKVGSLKSVKHENVIFTSTRATKLDPTTSSEFSVIKGILKQSATEAAGLVGEARYENNAIQYLKMTAHLNIKTYTELLYLTSVLADNIDSRFTQEFPITCLVYSQDELMAIITKDAKGNVKTNIIEQ